MADQNDDHLEQNAPRAKRTGREDPNPREQPGEFVDEMRSNRFGDVPPPGEPEK